ncbi:hypothetical protein [Herbidospora yilanensis]|uniref:hypothetical protein n=1 Tax=Herbidospora yilanensis TaxID=354426 RepID=UPI0007840CC7|nr:hypothetical protein [Herbidospora yilanensis]
MATFDRDAGLAEYHEALAKANESGRETPSSMSHRVRGVLIGLMGLVILAAAAFFLYDEWYGPTYGKPATGTVVEIEYRKVYVEFTPAGGVPQVGFVYIPRGEPLPKAGEPFEIRYLEGSAPGGIVGVWTTDEPSPIAWPVIMTLLALGALAAGAMEFSGRAPWHDAVVLDERSIKARSSRP